MNAKTRAAPLQSLGRTRPPLERECRAPDATVCSRDVIGSVRLVQIVSRPRLFPSGGRPVGRPRRPGGGSNARSVQTLERAPRDRARREPVRPFVDGTQENKAGGFSACEKPPVKAWTAPLNRVNFNFNFTSGPFCRHAAGLRSRRGSIAQPLGVDRRRRGRERDCRLAASSDSRHDRGGAGQCRHARDRG